MKQIYLAGPDVFYPDNQQRFARYKEACLAHRLMAHSPLDSTIDEAESRPALAEKIYLANIALIQRCDGVLANLTPFRGSEPDSGTVFEVGYAIALGKPVAGWGVAGGSYRESVVQTLGLAANAKFDAGGAEIEDFGLPLNLMLACSCTVNAMPQAIAYLSGCLN